MTTRKRSDMKPGDVFLYPDPTGKQPPTQICVADAQTEYSVEDVHVRWRVGDFLPSVEFELVKGQETVSSKPSTDSVRQLIERLAEYNKLVQEDTRLVEVVANAQAKRKELMPRMSELRLGIPKMLEAMGVHTNGNFDWEGRVLWLLAEFHRQMTHMSPDAQAANRKALEDLIRSKS